MKNHLFIITFLLAFVPSCWSQNYDTSWVGHFSYLDIKEVVYGEAKFYAASENAVFSYDPLSNELTTITTINGLSGELISTIYYSNQYELLLIGYENGLIEVYKESDQELLKVVDIINKITIPSSQKKINHFNEIDEVVYIATDYGISVYNLADLEFRDTYYIGANGSQVEVNQTAVFNNEIYAACGSNMGIKKASLSNPNLIDFQFWTTLTSGNFTNIVAFGTQLYTVNSNNRLFEIVGANLNSLFVYPQSVEDLKVSDNSLLVSTPSKVYQYTVGFNLLDVYTTNLEFETDFTSAVIIDNAIYIGTTDFGVLRSKAISMSEYDEIHPQGPLLNSVFSLEYGYNNLWVTYGAYSIFFVPKLKKIGISRFHNAEWNNVRYDSIQNTIQSNVYDLNSISINPLNTNQVFISSFFSGLLNIKTEESIELLNQENSGLESQIYAPNPDYVTIRISGSSFDNEANLWVLNSKVKNPLKKFNPSTNQWSSYDFSPIIPDPSGDELGFSDIAIGSDGTKWIGSYRSGLIGFNEDGMLLKNINDKDVANLPSPAVKALALDKNNVLWIGTYKGLRVLYNTSNFFSEGVISRTEPIIILEDGLPQELLSQQFISDIIVDGSNNKWISTADAGVFYVSSDGQKTIHHFTKDNSPLPSNSVNAMALDSENGIVYFGSTRGLVAFKTGGSSTSESLEEIYIYPNPVRPGFNMAEDKIKIKNISENVNIKITDIEGNLVAEAQSNVNLRYKNYNLEIDGGTAYWNGKNLANNTVASGVYLVLFSDFDTLETFVSKIMIIR